MIKTIIRSFITLQLISLSASYAAIDESEFKAQFWLFKDFDYLMYKGQPAFDALTKATQEITSGGTQSIDYYRQYAEGIRKARIAYQKTEALFWDQEIYKRRECQTLPAHTEKEKKFFELIPELQGKPLKSMSKKEKDGALEDMLGYLRAQFIRKQFEQDQAFKSIPTKGKNLMPQISAIEEKQNFLKGAIGPEALLISRIPNKETSFEWGEYQFAPVTQKDWSAIVNPQLQRTVYGLIFQDLLALHSTLYTIASGRNQGQTENAAQIQNILFNLSLANYSIIRELQNNRFIIAQQLLTIAQKSMIRLHEILEKGNPRYAQLLMKPYLLYETIQSITTYAQRAFAQPPALFIGYFTNQKTVSRAATAGTERNTLIRHLNTVRTTSENFFVSFRSLLESISAKNTELKEQIGKDEEIVRIAELTFTYTSKLYDELLADYQGIISAHAEKNQSSKRERTAVANAQAIAKAAATKADREEPLIDTLKKFLNTYNYDLTKNSLKETDNSYTITLENFLKQPTISYDTVSIRPRLYSDVTVLMRYMMALKEKKNKAVFETIGQITLTENPDKEAIIEISVTPDRSGMHITNIIELIQTLFTPESDWLKPNIPISFNPAPGRSYENIGFIADNTFINLTQYKEQLSTWKDQIKIASKQYLSYKKVLGENEIAVVISPRNIAEINRVVEYARSLNHITGFYIPGDSGIKTIFDAKSSLLIELYFTKEAKITDIKNALRVFTRVV